jgi:hypothetical protein
MARVITKPITEVPSLPRDYVGQNSYRTILETQQATTSKSIVKPVKNQDWITIIDIDHRRDGATQKTYDYITLPTIPLEVEYNNESSLQALPSFGRNNPFYQYTGSEDTLSFTIDFYSKVHAKDDVIYWCRWLEAMSKADGYRGGLHRLMIQWGRNSKLFSMDTWFVSKLNTKLSLFQGHMDLLPSQAFVDISFVKVVDHNRITQEIFGQFRQPQIPKLQNTPTLPNLSSHGLL